MKVISTAYKAGLAGLAIMTVLGVHSGAALAQQPASGDPDPSVGDGQAVQAPPEQQQQAPVQGYPPGYGPPPGYQQQSGGGYVPPQGYGPPPPRYSYYPPPPPPPTARSSTDRVFMIGGSLGLGTLRFDNDLEETTSGAAYGYDGRLGFGVAPRLLLLIGVNGAVSSEDSIVYDQTIYYLGLQAFLGRQFFVRGGAGLGNITGRDEGNFLSFGKTGFGVTASIGAELLQGYNWSLELAGQLTAGFYKDENWTGGTANIGFNFF